MTKNIDEKTVNGFGEEWAYFDQSTLTAEERLKVFNDYFAIFPWYLLPHEPEGFDFGCGSGRWAFLVSEKVKLLHCFDASAKALNVAKKKLSERLNITYHLVDGDQIPLPDNSQDFGYSLGVLHHIPDTPAALRSCVLKSITTARGGGLINIGPERCHNFSLIVGSSVAAQFPFAVPASGTGEFLFRNGCPKVYGYLPQPVK